MNPEQNLKRRNAMKRPKLIQICLLFLLCIGVAGWTTHASGQGGKDATAVTKEMEKTMPLLKGEQWQKMDPNSKVAFIWGAAHVILIENILMEEFPELRRENFSAKVVEARDAQVKAGKARTINEMVSAIDQYYKEHPDQLGIPVLAVIWNAGVKPHLKTGVAGRPLK
jgi:hypothetical protein